MPNKIIAKIEKKSYVVQNLSQWDINQELEIYGLSLDKTPQIHFANKLMEKAIVRSATMDGAGVVRVKVPNSLLQKPYNILAYICVSDGHTFETLYKLEIPLKPRKRPLDYTIKDESDEIYSFIALEALVNSTLHELRAEVAETNKVLTGRVDAITAQHTANVQTYKFMDIYATLPFTEPSEQSEFNSAIFQIESNGDDDWSGASDVKLIDYGITARNYEMTIDSLIKSAYYSESYNDIDSQCKLVHNEVDKRFRLNIFARDFGKTYTHCYLKVTIAYKCDVDITELKDIRVGADGITYDSAGEAIRTQLDKILNHMGVTWDDLG